MPNGVASKRASTAALPQQRAGVGGSRSVPPVFNDHDEHVPVAKKPKSASTKPVGTRVDANAQQAGPSTSRTPKQKVGPPAEPRYDGTPTRRPNGTPRASTSQAFEPVRVIRRVQAVIEVPVKQESDDDAEDLLSVDTGSEYDPETTKTPGKSAQKAKPRRRSSVKSRKAVQSDEDSDYDELPPAPPTARRRPPPNVDSDDELTMGPEVSSSVSGTESCNPNHPYRNRSVRSVQRPTPLPGSVLQPQPDVLLPTQRNESWMGIQHLLQGVSPRKLRGSDNIYAFQVFSRSQAYVASPSPCLYLYTATCYYASLHMSGYLLDYLCNITKGENAIGSSLITASAGGGFRRLLLLALAVPNCSVLCTCVRQNTIIHQNHHLRSPPLGVPLDNQMLV